MRASRQDHAPRPHPPHALPDTGCGAPRKLVGQALGNGQEIVIVIAKYRGTSEHAHLRQYSELCHLLRDPIRCQYADQGRVAGEQAAAQLGFELGQDYPRPGATRGQRRHQARRPTAHDE